MTGEYGHLHHIQVHEAVVSILKERYELDKLLVFDPIKHDTKLELSQEKFNQIGKNYDVILTRFSKYIENSSFGLMLAKLSLL